MPWRLPTPEEKRASYEKAAALGQRLTAEGWSVAIVEMLKSEWEVRVRIPMMEETDDE